MESDFPGLDRKSVGQELSCFKSLADEHLEESEVEFSRISRCWVFVFILFYEILILLGCEFYLTKQVC